MGLRSKSLKLREQRAWGLATILLACTLLQGCIVRKHDPNLIRFRYWGDLEEIGIIEGLLKDFEAANPGVRVEAERKNADSSYADTLLQEFAANTAPDVIFASTDNIELLKESRQLADLNPFLEREKDLRAADYYESLIKRFSQDGKLLALPRDIAPVAVVYYNKNLFNQAHLPYPKDDWHWEDLRQDALKLTLRDPQTGRASQLGFADDWNLYDAWILSSGGGVVDDYYNPSRLTMAENPAIQGILFRWKLLQVDKVMPNAGDSQAMTGGSMAMFLNGQVAMFHSGIWKTPAFRKIDSFSWDVVRFPTMNNAIDPKFLSGGSGYAMRSQVNNPELCWKLIKFMAGPEGQRRLAETGLSQPALKALAASPAFLDGKDPQNKKMLLFAAEHGEASPAWVDWQEYYLSIWGPTTDPIWLPNFQGDPAAVIKKAQDLGNQNFFQ